MNRKFYSRLLLVSSLVFLIQCSPGSFKSETSPSASSGVDKSGGSDNTGTGGTDTSKEDRRKELLEAINNASMTGMAINSSTNAPNIDFDRKAGAYLVRVPMIVFPDVGFDMQFPEYPGMRLYVEYVSSKPYITLFIPVKYVLRNVTEVPTKLPNGDALPLFPAGEPPSKAILLTPNKERKVYLYLSAEAFGIYAEASFDPGNIGGVILNMVNIPIQNPEKTKILGHLSYVPKKNNFKGGFFLSHRIDPKLGKILDEYYLY